MIKYLKKRHLVRLDINLEICNKGDIVTENFSFYMITFF